MCGSCWAEAGSPTDTGPLGERVIELIGALYVHCPTGGPLHCELDDYNLGCEDDEDQFNVIKPLYVIKPYGLTPGYPDNYSPEVHAICDELADLLNRMTVPQRYAALHQHDEREILAAQAKRQAEKEARDGLG